MPLHKILNHYIVVKLSYYYFFNLKSIVISICLFLSFFFSISKTYGMFINACWEFKGLFRIAVSIITILKVVFFKITKTFGVLRLIDEIGVLKIK
jgi:hypothetical protein